MAVQPPFECREISPPGSFSSSAAPIVPWIDRHQSHAAGCLHLDRFMAIGRSPDEVPRVAEYQHAQAEFGGRFMRGPDERPMCAVVAKRVGDQATAGVLDGAPAGRAGWKMRQNPVTRL
jgi:hypothetical protein